MPLVSVIIPNYNHARFLDQRIRSVLGQTLTDLQIIILDDASTDTSRQVIARYANEPRVHVVLNAHNSGSACHQWNVGAALSVAPYVWIAEADDDAEPDFLATLVDRLEAKPNSVLAYSQSWIIDEHGQRIGDLNDWTADLSADRWQKDFCNDGQDECARFLILKNTIPNASAVVFRRRDFIDAGAAYEGMRLCGDWMTWSRLLLRGEVIFTSSHLNHFRRHSATVRSTTSSFQLLSESLDVSRFITEHVPLTVAGYQRAAHATQEAWWGALRTASLPSFTSILKTSKKAAHLGRAQPIRLLAMLPLAYLARAPMMRCTLSLKRKLTKLLQS